jgi:glutathione S-transferase
MGDATMSDDLIFYTHPMSRGRIVRWMLEEVGQPYETILLDYQTSLKGADYLALNPMGKIPALRHGETVVTECAAICAYLADAFPEAGLAPPLADKRRGPYFRWLFFAAGPIEAAVTNKALGFEVPPERQRMAGYGSLEHVLDTIEFAIGDKPFLLGDTFSAADVYFGSQLMWGLMFKTIATRPAFERYVAHLAQRPAARRAREIDDALLPSEQRMGRA